MKILIVGAGVIGGRRAAGLPPGTQLVGVVDPALDRAKALADQFGTKAYSSLEEFKEPCDGAIVASINSAIVPSAQKLLDRGIPVLLEKPAARSAKELESLKNPKGLPVKIGFNHRFHPAYQDLLKELASNPQDPIFMMRARYGNGARLGFDQEWRSKVDLAGGGELMDQGVHVLDLALNIVPDLEVKAALARTLYWQMPVDDNTWGLLESPQGVVFSFHVSSSEWKNEFQFDVYTRKRKYVWKGLGRSYGPETLTIYKMKPEMGPPDLETREYPAEDHSWLDENSNFLSSIAKGSSLNGSLKDGILALRAVEKIYTSSKTSSAPGSGTSASHPRWYQL